MNCLIGVNSCWGRKMRINENTRSDKLMEKYYINAEAFKRKLIDEKNFFPAMVSTALKEMPKEDVEEVVRCGRCKFAHFNKNICTFSCKRRDCFSEFVKPTDFCSYGERRAE